jgi:hypothetical protein
MILRASDRLPGLRFGGRARGQTHPVHDSMQPRFLSLVTAARTSARGAVWLGAGLIAVALAELAVLA